MKIKLILLFIISVRVVCAQNNLESEYYYVEYGLNFNKTIISENNQKSFTKVVLLITDSVTVNMDYLKFESEMSKYKGEPSANPDKYSGLSPITIKEKVDKKTIILEHLDPPNHIGIQEKSMDINDWEITNENRLINGYSAIKATCEDGGRTWEAWFTPEIPISDGPYKFSGLPGLIVKLKSTDEDFDFEIISLSEMAEERYIPFEFKYEILSKNKFEEIMRKRGEFLFETMRNKKEVYIFDMKENDIAIMMEYLKREDALRINIEFK